MGDADYLLSPEGAVDHYVMCWFDDTEPDMTKDLRRFEEFYLKEKSVAHLTSARKRTIIIQLSKPSTPNSNKPPKYFNGYLWF